MVSEKSSPKHSMNWLQKASSQDQHSSIGSVSVRQGSAPEPPVPEALGLLPVPPVSSGSGGASLAVRPHPESTSVRHANVMRIVGTRRSLPSLCTLVRAVVQGPAIAFPPDFVAQDFVRLGNDFEDGRHVPFEVIGAGRQGLGSKLAKQGVACSIHFVGGGSARDAEHAEIVTLVDQRAPGGHAKSERVVVH